MTGTIWSSNWADQARSSQLRYSLKRLSQTWTTQRRETSNSASATLPDSWRRACWSMWTATRPSDPSSSTTRASTSKARASTASSTSRRTATRLLWSEAEFPASWIWSERASMSCQRPALARTCTWKSWTTLVLFRPTWIWKRPRLLRSTRALSSSRRRICSRFWANLLALKQRCLRVREASMLKLNTRNSAKLNRSSCSRQVSWEKQVLVLSLMSNMKRDWRMETFFLVKVNPIDVILLFFFFNLKIFQIIDHYCTVMQKYKN